MLFGADSWLKGLHTSPSCSKDSGEIIYLLMSTWITYHPVTLSGKLCQINRVRHLFTKAVLSVILHLEQQNITFLQNFAARILTGERKYDHILPHPSRSVVGET